MCQGLSLGGSQCRVRVCQGPWVFGCETLCESKSVCQGSLGVLEFDCLCWQVFILDCLCSWLSGLFAWLFLWIAFGGGGGAGKGWEPTNE